MHFKVCRLEEVLGTTPVCKVYVCKFVRLNTFVFELLKRETTHPHNSHCSRYNRPNHILIPHEHHAHDQRELGFQQVGLRIELRLMDLEFIVLNRYTIRLYLLLLSIGGQNLTDVNGDMNPIGETALTPVNFGKLSFPISLL